MDINRRLVGEIKSVGKGATLLATAIATKHGELQTSINEKTLTSVIQNLHHEHPP